MVMKHFMIYGLIDPETRELRYVGQTSKGFDRLKVHVRHAIYGHRRQHVSSWINKLHKLGSSPVMIVLHEWEQAPSINELNEAERLYIEHFRSRGYDLCNLTDGGERVIFSEDVRKRISETKRHNPHPYRGKHLSEEHKRTISHALVGRTCSDAHKRKVGLSNGWPVADDLGNIFEGIADAARYYGCSDSSIWMYIKKKRTPTKNKATGRTFRYVNV